jgi:hypothetical protein
MYPKDDNNHALDFYSDLSPEHLVLRHAGKTAQVDRAELQRARWFWERRPTASIYFRFREIINVVGIYIAMFLSLLGVGRPSLSCMCNLIAIGATLVLLVGGAFMDISRYNRWKSDYDRAIVRLIGEVDG